MRNASTYMSTRWATWLCGECWTQWKQPRNSLEGISTQESECLAQILPLGERQLRRAVREYAEHYRHERNHQGLGNRLIDPSPNLAICEDAVACRNGLGGVLCYYERAA